MDMEDNWHIYIPENSGLPDNHVYTLALDDQGQVWAGTWDGISLLGTDDRWETTSLFDLGIAGEYEIVTDIVFDDSGRFLIGTTAGLVIREPDGSLTQYTSNDSELINDYIQALYIDDHGRIWIGTAGGLSILETDGAWTNYPSGNALLPLGGITDLAIDSQGRVWAGTTWGVSILVP
jgi:ligand-binding sensor domain-containing protein